jgi:cyclopropane fatty-acyl-phospholipid synthase-like methyltransferase
VDLKGRTVAREETKPALPSTLYDKDYFLTACEGHEEFIKSQGENLSRRLREAFAVASVEPGMRVLDVGCGRGEIVRHCARLGAHAYGIDYAQVAVDLSQELLQSVNGPVPGKMSIYQADAKRLPFASGSFDRVLMFDVVEHLYPWELDAAMAEIKRTLRPGGMFVVHTAPNRWYDVYAYPVVRLIRTLQGRGRLYPRNPRALNVAVNQDVHVNEQDMLGLRRNLKRAGFGQVQVWLDTPPQHRREPWPFKLARYIAFRWPPFRWFFEREVFAVAVKV